MEALILKLIEEEGAKLGEILRPRVKAAIDKYVETEADPLIDRLIGVHIGSVITGLLDEAVGNTSATVAPTPQPVVPENEVNDNTSEVQN